MRVRTPHAERSRIPRQCQSSGGKSDPKGKPSGDPDGKQVNIPVLIITAMQRRRGDTAAYWRNSTLKPVFFDTGSEARR
jgi:hypothetical protein